MADELTKLILSELHDCIRRYKEALKEQKHISISIDRGYAENDPWLVTYSIGSYSDTDKCQGSDLYSTINEYVRRKGWTEENKPMTLIENHMEENDPQPDVTVPVLPGSDEYEDMIRNRDNDDTPF